MLSAWCRGEEEGLLAEISILSSLWSPSGALLPPAFLLRQLHILSHPCGVIFPFFFTLLKHTHNNIGVNKTLL